MDKERIINKMIEQLKGVKLLMKDGHNYVEIRDRFLNRVIKQLEEFA